MADRARATGVFIDFYLEREKLRRTLRELLEVPGETLLDVGCRSGELARALATEGRRVVAVDVRRSDRWPELRPVRFVHGNALSLPFRDESFDLVASGECLQYVRDWRRALDEFHRVLKPGGRVVFSVPNGNFVNERLDPYNVIHRIRGQRLMKFPPSGQVLAHRPEAWEHEVVIRRGSLVFIYAAWSLELVQKLRSLATRRFSRRSRIDDALLTPLLRVPMGIMGLDFEVPLGVLSYNAIYRFRKR